MKNIFKIFIFIGLVSFSSCEEFVNLEQPGRLGAEQAFSSVDDLNSGLLGVYNDFDYSPQVQFNAVFTDMVSIGFDNGGQGLGGEYTFQLNSASAISNALWTNFYTALNSASRVIEAAELIEPQTEEEQTLYNDVLGQTYALRAWGHFELLTYYSPDLTDDASQGVIILDFVPGVSDNLARSTTGEVFDAIEADLAQAESLLTVDSDPTFVSRDFVKALRARIAAYRGDYATAGPLAEELLEDYPLANRAEYTQVFADESNAEIIFKLERTIGDTYDIQGATGSGLGSGWVGANFAFVNATVDGSPYFEMSNGLFNQLEEGDIRRDVLVQETADIDAGIIPIGKYEGSENQPLMNDLKIFRASEMLFIAAEARVAAGDLPGAATLMAELLNARYETAQPVPNYPNATAAYKAILDQRRIELAYEGFRWVDIKRLGGRAGINGLNRAASDCEQYGACSLPLSDPRLNAVPIPLVELDANENMRQTDIYN